MRLIGFIIAIVFIQEFTCYKIMESKDDCRKCIAASSKLCTSISHKDRTLCCEESEEREKWIESWDTACTVKEINPNHYLSLYWKVNDKISPIKEFKIPDDSSLLIRSGSIAKGSHIIYLSNKGAISKDAILSNTTYEHLNIHFYGIFVNNDIREFKFIDSINSSDSNGYSRGRISRRFLENSQTDHFRFKVNQDESILLILEPNSTSDGNFTTVVTSEDNGNEPDGGESISFWSFVWGALGIWGLCICWGIGASIKKKVCWESEETERGRRED